MSYYNDELNQLPPDDGYGLSIQVRCAGKATKWMSLTEECRHALLAFMVARSDPESMTEETQATYWKTEYDKIASIETASRGELANYLADPICPATWHHIVAAVRELILFRDCAKKVVARLPENYDRDWVDNNYITCLEFLELAERRRKS